MSAKGMAGPVKGHFDVVIVGAGWGGIYLVERMRRSNLSLVLFEAGTDVGGTWYWNRYPGARVDTPSVDYSFSFDPQLEQDWHWNEHYSPQPDVESYAQHVAERFDLYRDMRFGARVESATYDAAANLWRVRTGAGDDVTAKYCIMATGGYSEPIKPNIPNIDAYKGDLYFTARYPKNPAPYAGKRIGVIGTGSSGMQTATWLATKEDVGHLYVFQRTANFAIPCLNRPMDDEYEQAVKSNYRARREVAKGSGSGTPYPGKSGPVAKLSDEEFEARMDEVWQMGGPAVIAGLSDIVVDIKANDRVADYSRDKVRQRVKDPEVAEKLVPRGHLFISRRTLIEDGYYEIYNQDNVTLVDVKADPIETFTEKGLVVGGKEIELDMIICATGFDSGTGGLFAIDITGENGAKLPAKWSDNLWSYLGIFIDGFPNLFSVDGPGSPSIRSNMLHLCELQADWIGDLLDYGREHGVIRYSTTPEAEKAWTDHADAVVAATLLAHDDTQYCGANVPGKARHYLAYCGGVGAYRRITNAIRDAGYEGLKLETANGVLDNPKTWSGNVPQGTPSEEAELAIL